MLWGALLVLAGLGVVDARAEPVALAVPTPTEEEAPRGRAPLRAGTAVALGSLAWPAAGLGLAVGTAQLDCPGLEGCMMAAMGIGSFFVATTPVGATTGATVGWGGTRRGGLHTTPVPWIVACAGLTVESVGLALLTDYRLTRPGLGLAISGASLATAAAYTQVGFNLATWRRAHPRTRR